MRRTAVEFRPPFFVAGTRSDLAELGPRLAGRAGVERIRRVVLRPSIFDHRPRTVLEVTPVRNAARRALARVGRRAGRVRPLHPLRRRPLPAATLPPRPRPLPVRPGRRVRRRDSRDRARGDRRLRSPAPHRRPPRGHAERAAPRPPAAGGGADRRGPARRRRRSRGREEDLLRALVGELARHGPGRPPHPTAATRSTCRGSTGGPRRSASARRSSRSAGNRSAFARPAPPARSRRTGGSCTARRRTRSPGGSTSTGRPRSSSTTRTSRGSSTRPGSPGSRSRRSPASRRARASPRWRWRRRSAAGSTSRGRRTGPSRSGAPTAWSPPTGAG